jgi:hypothetical protein
VTINPMNQQTTLKLRIGFPALLPHWPGDRRVTPPVQPVFSYMRRRQLPPQVPVTMTDSTSRRIPFSKNS